MLFEEFLFKQKNKGKKVGAIRTLLFGLKSSNSFEIILSHVSNGRNNCSPLNHGIQFDVQNIKLFPIEENLTSSEEGGQNSQVEIT